VKSFLNHDPGKDQENKTEDGIYTEALKNADPKLLEELGLEQETLATSSEAANPAPETPVCDRCHNLIHHHVGTPIHHPSVDAIQQTIAESPHRRNHIYHVVDAADFPLSLVPNLQSALRLPKLRTHNRRAKHKGWVANNRIAEVSFVITRADLLAPMKEQVDKLLPYMQEVLRAALGRVNKDARLGNIHLVSAKRGWWTKKIKEDIWERGGAGWMVGKVNVGKSNLFEVVFPKGRGSDYQDVHRSRTFAEREQALANAKSLEEVSQIQKELDEEEAEIERRRRQPVLQPEEQFPEEEEDMEPDDNALLPPRQPYTPYPVLPIASSLPGTTASPIRIPFGRNRGELIDLPGLARTNPDLSTFVKPEEHDQLVMKSRVTPQRHVLKPGQSLLLGGGLIRITPKTEDLIFLVHPFVPLSPHVTATEKAIGLQTQTRESNIPSALSPDISPSQIRSAGTFKLRWDATKKLAGPLTSSTAGKMRPENLPWQIFSTDLLIEGVGWVEISAQVRKPKGWKPVGLVKKDPNHARIEREQRLEEDRLRRQKNYEEKLASGGGDAFDRAGMTSYQQDKETREKERRREAAAEFVDDMVEQYPEVEVFSPLGKYIGARMPMCGSVLGGPKPVSSRERQVRPRRAMKPIRGKEVAARKEKRRETSG
jgi:ribosome biogenesis GTPase A